MDLVRDMKHPLDAMQRVYEKSRKTFGAMFEQEIRHLSAVKAEPPGLRSQGQSPRHVRSVTGATRYG